jgi:hypothetical protein
LIPTTSSTFRRRSVIERRRTRRTEVRPPHVRLGELQNLSLAPALAAIIDRGVQRRPSVAARLNTEIELKVEGPYPPVRIVFSAHGILVEDGPATDPQLKVEGSLTDIISLMVTPTLGGVPSPVRSKGARAIRQVAFGQVRVEGRIGLMRRLLALLRF